MGTIYRNGTAFIGSGGAGGVELTQAEYDALPTTEKMNGSIYFISDGEASYPSASTMRYDNSTSGLTATSVQDAVDEVNEKVNDNAGDIAELNNGLTNKIAVASYEKQTTSGVFFIAANELPAGVTTSTHWFIAQPTYGTTALLGYAIVLQMSGNRVVCYIRQGTTMPADGSRVLFNLFCIKK